MTNVTIIGNLTEAPELRFTAQGKAVANFTIAEQNRVKVNGEWTDGDTTFWRCSLWDSAAENLTESAKKGDRVIAVGEAKQRSFETKTGEKRTVVEVTVSEIGPSVRWAICSIGKVGSRGPAKPKPEPARDAWDDAEAPF